MEKEYNHKIGKKAIHPIAFARGLLAKTDKAMVMNLDKKLTIATVIVFFAIGAISLYGIYDFSKNIKLSIGIILILALLLQSIVLLLALTGRKLRFLRNSYYKKVGSSLIHLGIVAIALTIIQPTWLYFGNINVFWLSTAIISIGMLLIFYFPEKRRVAIG